MCEIIEWWSFLTASLIEKKKTIQTHNKTKQYYDDNRMYLHHSHAQHPIADGWISNETREKKRAEWEKRES